MSAAQERLTVGLAAGGTGGHIFPAEATAAALAEAGHKLVLFTDSRGSGFASLPDVEVVQLPGAMVVGQSKIKQLLALAKLGKGAMAARKPLRQLGVQAVVGFGGYPSVPPLWAANGLGIPTVLHDQNAVVGRATRLLAGKASAIATSFPGAAGLPAEAARKVVLTGNPVRKAFLDIGRQPYPMPSAEGPINLVVTGGSQGARVLDELVPSAIAALPEDLRLRLHLIQQVREADSAQLAARYRDLGVVAKIAPFFRDLPDHVAQAHLMICRAGASTVTELAAAGRPAILLPYPFAADDHQRANAAALAAVEGAVSLPQEDLTLESLSAALSGLLGDPQRLGRMAKAARQTAIDDSADRLAALACDVARGRAPATAKEGQPA